MRAIKDENVLKEICNYFVNMITENSGSKKKVNYEELKNLVQQSNKFTFFEFKNRRITFK